jgi:hypothetical protein
MSADGTVETTNTVEASVEEIKPDAAGKYPETVPWNQYVRTKETIGNKLTKATEQVKTLEEQLKKAVKPEDLEATKKELEALKVEKQKTADELKAIKESSTAEKRASLVKMGVPEEEVKKMSAESLETAVKVLGYAPKPGADMGNGGGGMSLKGSPMELARQAYSNSK